VLPTGGLARAAGGLGLEAFLKSTQVVSATPEGLDAMRETIAALAAAEGLPLHAAAVEARFAQVAG
jgi:histidinol dehydrogenase